MKRLLLAGLAAMAGATGISADPVTIETNLAELGITNGVLLSSGEASSVFVPVPREAAVGNVTVDVEGRVVAPNLDRGSLVVSVNGMPVDAARIEGDGTASRLGLETMLEKPPSTASGLDIRFRADLIAPAAVCEDETDPANTLTILPSTRIAYDVDPERITSLSGALALVPRRAAIALPEADEITPQIAASAIQAGAVLLARGRDIAFVPPSADELVLVTIAPDAETALALEHAGHQLQIAVSTEAGVAALWQLWQNVPGVLASASSISAQTQGEGRESSPQLWHFANLPGAQPVKRRGEFTLRFPMVGANRQLPSEAILEVAVAPDWSGAPPIASVYVNGQLVTAARLSSGRNAIHVPLPEGVLDFDNDLRLVVDRAAAARAICAEQHAGHAVQVLAGSGVRYDRIGGDGFAAFARQLQNGVTLALPQDVATSSALPDYLDLAAKLLAGLGAVGVPVEVSFGPLAESASPTIRFVPSTQEALALTLAGQGEPDFRFTTDAPLAGIAVGEGGTTLEVQLLDDQALPDPRDVLLGNASRALIGDAGVLWQNSVASSDRPLVVEARDATQSVIDYLRRNGLWVAAGLVLLVGAIVGARAMIRRIYRDRRPR